TPKGRKAINGSFSTCTRSLVRHAHGNSMRMELKSSTRRRVEEMNRNLVRRLEALEQRQRVRPGWKLAMLYRRAEEIAERDSIDDFVEAFFLAVDDLQMPFTLEDVDYLMRGIEDDPIRAAARNGEIGT